MPAEILEHCNTVEECYEFMLAYAAQGRPSDQGQQVGRTDSRISAARCNSYSSAGRRMFEGCERGTPRAGRKISSIPCVLDRDAQDSLAAIDLVLAQPSISSQLVDNLNASVHLRALLTDLFLVSDILRSQLKVLPIG